MSTRTWQITRAMLTAGTLETLRRKELYVILIHAILMVLGANYFPLLWRARA